MITDLVVDALSPYGDLILPGFYVAFFAGTLVLLALSDREMARRVWLAGFLSVLVVITVLGAPVLPVVDMHKFSQPTPEERTYHEFRVVDADGEEIRYDTRAIPPMQGTRTSSLGYSMIERYDDERRLELAAFMLKHAREYRANVEAGGPSAVERLQPPRYVDEERWTAADLAGLSMFESLRVYRHTIVFSADSTEIESKETTLELEVTPGDGTIKE